jgi:hypothetical protein
MSDKLPEIEDLTQEKARNRTLDVELSAEERTIFQAEADKCDVTLEEYVLWRLLTAAAVGTAGGNSTSSGGAA